MNISSQLAIEPTLEPVNYCDIYRFEFAFAESGNVLLSFMGRPRLSEISEAALQGNDFILYRDNLPALRFKKLKDQDIQYLASATRILIYRKFADDEEVTEAKIK